MNLRPTSYYVVCRVVHAGSSLEDEITTCVASFKKAEQIAIQMYNNDYSFFLNYSEFYNDCVTVGKVKIEFSNLY